MRLTLFSSNSFHHASRTSCRYKQVRHQETCTFFPMVAHHMTAYEEVRNEYWPAVKYFFDEYLS